ncbi:MAG: hypothetical protein IT565_11390 [Rhodospirillales bacterium]|nr:hypothetical protein [Rhodospirillales bacterium]
MKRPIDIAKLGLRRVRLVWSIAAFMLLTMAFSSFWFAYEEYERTLELEFGHLESYARIADAQLAGLLRNLNRLLTDIAEDQATLAPEKEAEYDLFLQAQKRNFPEIRSLVVVNAEGRVTLTGNPNLKGFDSSKRDYFVAHLDRPPGPNFYASRPFKTSFGDLGIAFSVGIYDAEKRFQGTVVSGVDPKYFETVLAQVRPSGAQSTAALFNRHGEFIYRVPDPERFFGTSVGAGAAFRRFNESNPTMSRNITLAASDGIRRLFVLRAIGETQLVVSVSRIYDDVLAGWRRNIALRLLVFGLAAAVILGMTAIAHRRQRERQEMENRLRQSVDRLTSSNIELERFAYIASHDLREPVRTLVSFSQMLERKLGPDRPTEINDYLDFVVRAARRMDALVSDLLAYSRVNSDLDSFEPVHLDRVLADVRHDLGDAIGRTGATLEAQPLPLVKGVHMQLHQLFQNLISNALKFQKPGQPPQIVITASDELDRWRISLADNGIGIDPKYAKQIFVIFKRLHTEKAYPGTGVGLAICRRIMERHGGEIEVESEGEGRGSVFHLLFPK